eukprot:UN01453
MLTFCTPRLGTPRGAPRGMKSGAPRIFLHVPVMGGAREHRLACLWHYRALSTSNILGKCLKFVREPLNKI